MVRAMNLFFPLYIYPNNCYQNPNSTACAWYPLYQQAAFFPQLQFNVVVNPASGPGSTACPDVNYVQAIAFLNKFPNIQKLGYIDSAWTKMPVANYTRDIKTYANWANKSTCGTTMGVDGLFVDDMLNTNDAATKAYYKNISAVVNSTMPAGKNYLMLNPGTPVDVGFYNYAHMILSFESFYKNENQTGTVFNSTAWNNCPRQKQTYCAHDFINGTNAPAVQQQVSDRMGQTNAMGGFFLTDKVLTDKKNPYNEFPYNWGYLTWAVNATNFWMKTHASSFP